MPVQKCLLKNPNIFFIQKEKESTAVNTGLHIKLGTFSIRLVLEHLREQQCLPEGKAAKRLAAG